MSSDTAYRFTEITLSDLNGLDVADVDALTFGVVGLSPQGIVEVYNATESRLAGLPRHTVMGDHYFSVTAQCMNNFLVAQRFADEATLDVMLDYVLTLRMRPTPVRLRLLKGPDSALDYILINRIG